MTRRPFLPRALVAATALAAVLPASAAHSSPTPPSTLGPAAAAERAAPVPRATSLVGRQLRLADGRAVRLPRAAGVAPILLGTVRTGWVVAAGNSFRLVGPGGDVRRISGRNSTELYVTEALSDDGRRIISAATDQGDTFSIRVVDLQGRVVVDTWFQNLFADVTDADDGRVYLAGSTGARVVHENGRLTRAVRRPTALVAAEHDLVFVGTRRQPLRVGPTSLSAPGTPTWRARSQPVAVSPDGRYVVSRDGTVRRVRDGHVVRRVPVSTTSVDGEFRFLGWGSSARVLLERTAGRRQVLVSCRVPRGACRRVGSTTGNVSLPTSHAGPYRQP